MMNLLKSQISSILSEEPVSDSIFPVGEHGRIAVYVTTGIGYTIQAFDKENLLFSVTDFEYSAAVHKFIKILDSDNKNY